MSNRESHPSNYGGPEKRRYLGRSSKTLLNHSPRQIFFSKMDLGLDNDVYPEPEQINGYGLPLTPVANTEYIEEEHLFEMIDLASNTDTPRLTIDLYSQIQQELDLYRLNPGVTQKDILIHARNLFMKFGILWDPTD